MTKNTAQARLFKNFVYDGGYNCNSFYSQAAERINDVIFDADQKFRDCSNLIQQIRRAIGSANVRNVDELVGSYQNHKKSSDEIIV
uniref:Uncharacterized protein n=1 Tax=Rhabditophanes sp. KR3021 TaxID=114890 RepID=A0AC35UIB7_9BILA